jgi:hypothetical protein
MALKKEEEITKPPTLGLAHCNQSSNVGRAPKSPNLPLWGAPIAINQVIPNANQTIK